MHKISELSQAEKDAINEILAEIDWEPIPGQFNSLTEELNLRELTTSELAQIMGVSDRRVAKLWEDGVIPEPRYDGQQHWHPLLDTVSAYISYLKRWIRKV